MSVDLHEESPRRVPWGTIGTLALLVLVFFGARYVVQNYRRPGAMSVIEAQAMDMSVMKPPIGALPVAVVTARRGTLEARVTYPGTAIAWTEQDIAARVTGRLVEMPVYPGTKVRRGQLLARLDSDELRQRENEARFAGAAAAQERLMAGAEAQQAQAEARRVATEAKREAGGLPVAQGELASAKAAQSEAASGIEVARASIRDAQAAQDAATRGVTGAQAEAQAAEREAQTRSAEIEDAGAALDDARSDVENARAALDAAKARLPQAQAEVEALRADASFAREKVKRSAELVKQGAISREEFQQDEAAAKSADAKVKQALSRVAEVSNDVRAAQASVQKSEAGVRQMQAKIRVAQGNREAALARVQSAQAKVTQMQAEIGRAKAGVQGRKAELDMAVQRVRRMQADITTAAAKTQQAAAAAQGARQAAQGASHGAEKARLAQGRAALLAQQAQASLSTAHVIRGYTEIRAATDGIVAQRLVAPGSLVNAGSMILKIQQVNLIRLQANVAQSDLDQIQIGASVEVRSPSDPKKRLQTTVSAVFPSADAQSRLGIVEAVAPNEKNRFKPGEAIVMDIAKSRNFGALKVPSAAIVRRADTSREVIASQQTATVWTMEDAPPENPIYTCTMHPQIRQNHPGLCPICHMKLTPLMAGGHYRAHQAPIKTGVTNGDYTEIISGLKDGARVIYRGYENLKEHDSVMPDKPLWSAENQPAKQRAGSPPSSGVQTIKISVSAQGFSLPNITLKAGVPARLIFTRIAAEGCGTEVVFPDLKIRKALPLNQPVAVEFTPQSGKTLSFACGMDMMKGQVVVR